MRAEVEFAFARDIVVGDVLAQMSGFLVVEKISRRRTITQFPDRTSRGERVVTDTTDVLFEWRREDRVAIGWVDGDRSGWMRADSPLLKKVAAA